MEQRRLRLGDILDDYCPRERRVTNHAVVAMIEEDVKQTRCTTCDAEHAYKGGKAPRRRKKETTGTLYKDVLAGMSEHDTAPLLSSPAPAADSPAETVADVEPAIEAPQAPPGDDLSTDTMAAAESESDDLPHEPPARGADDGPVHRPLIRATLPRPEGQKDARPLPEFTVRQRGNGNFRGADPRMKQRGGQGPNGNRAHGGGRFAGPRAGGSGRGPGHGPGGFRTSQGPSRRGKKRSR